MGDLEIQNELRGRLVSQFIRAGVRPLDLSAEDYYPPFSTKFSSLEGFDELFEPMLLSLRDSGLITYQALCSGTLGETCAVGARATEKLIAMRNQTSEEGCTAKNLVAAAEAGDIGLYAKLGSFVGHLIGGVVSELQ